MNPALPIFPPTTYGAAPLMGIPYNPVLGKYGTADLTMKGYNKGNNCQFGFYPSNIYGQGACCDVFGNCGIGDQSLTFPANVTSVVEQLTQTTIDPPSSTNS